MSAAPHRHLTAAETSRIANHALAEQREEDWVGPVAASADRHREDPVLWQWAALLHRALDDREAAIYAFDRAAGLAPRNAKIVHGLARTRWEAGLPSLEDYGRALALAPFDGDVLLGMAAARVTAGDRDGALAGIEAILAREPRWIEGQRQAASLRFMRGEVPGYVAGIEHALGAHPREEGLWQELLTLLQQSGDHDRTAAAAIRARGAIGDRPFITAALATVASSTGDVRGADLGFAALSPLNDVSVTIHHVRHLLRNARIDHVGTLLDHWLNQPEATAFHPYATLVWRLTGDPRIDWLERNGALIRTFDLTASLPPLDRLATTLRGLHHDGGHPLDQSVRGGSQTDGPLFANLNADVQQTRLAVLEAVRTYMDGLPPVALRHPTLEHRRNDRPRFAGSWSVRLRGAGRHANHVHPAGWISSALYVGLPSDRPGDEPEAGWLSLGEPPSELRLDLSAERMIKPVSGTLVLFPSTTWHGTRPFMEGERLTIAFDIARPVPR